jgi:DNA-binding response OmpR family regulator
MENRPVMLAYGKRGIMSDGNSKVLIADDDLEILRILRKRLSQHFEIVEAHNGEEALRLAESHHPDCVVLDVMMPELNGWEVARALRKQPEFDGTGILMLTAIGESLNEMTSPLYGADDQIDKPFDLDEVVDKINEILTKHSG